MDPIDKLIEDHRSREREFIETIHAQHGSDIGGAVEAVQVLLATMTAVSLLPPRVPPPIANALVTKLLMQSTEAVTAAIIRLACSEQRCHDRDGLLRVIGELMNNHTRKINDIYAILRGDNK